MSSGFWVYVIELSPDVVAGEYVGYVYVGETNLTPEERFERHRSGRRSSKTVRNYGLRLRPDLAPDGNPFPSRDEALEWEAITAEDLRDLGYYVPGRHGEGFMSR